VGVFQKQNLTSTRHPPGVSPRRPQEDVRMKNRFNPLCNKKRDTPQEVSL